MRVTFEIKRFNPEKDNEPYFQSYELDMEPKERVLDALLKIKSRLDDSLVFRKSCAHGVCGSDAVRINGKDRLACKTLIKDVVKDDNRAVRVEPLRHFTVQRDLMVDQSGFFERYKAVKPYLINDEKPEEKERIQTVEDRKKFDDATNCILCSACMSACPVIDDNPEFIGPAIIVQAARFNDDSRDRGFEARLEVLDARNGVWPCDNKFECTKACPRGIKITKLINLSKRRITKFKEGEKNER